MPCVLGFGFGFRVLCVGFRVSDFRFWVLCSVRTHITEILEAASMLDRLHEVISSSEGELISGLGLPMRARHKLYVVVDRVYEDVLPHGFKMADPTYIYAALSWVAQICLLMTSR